MMAGSISANADPKLARGRPVQTLGSFWGGRSCIGTQAAPKPCSSQSVSVDVILTHPVGVNLTHLGNDGGFLATDNVDSGASSGDQ
ncbi:hypothetical protein, partial [Candidimonas nitroreducens]|uniref:hypothetical protein n=1 Tax=Candidimonas nitroreducens TaxID=683354 RepID=UPI001E43D384